MADEVLVAVEAGIATLTLNRPDQRNAMNTALLQGLRSAIDSLDERRDVRRAQHLLHRLVAANLVAPHRHARRGAWQAAGVGEPRYLAGLMLIVGTALAAVFNARLSTVILACGAYISSQLCSDQ